MFCDYSCVKIAYAYQQLNRNMRKAKQLDYVMEFWIFFFVISSFVILSEYNLMILFEQ